MKSMPASAPACIPLAVVTCLGVLSAALPAASAQTTREAGAHVHGKAEMAIVVEGRAVTVEVRSALYNIVGFEHAPETPAETKTWEAASQKVRTAAGVVTLDKAARCTPVSASAGILGGKTPVAADEDHDHDHDHGEHEHEGHDHGAFGDVTLTYVFNCTQPSKLARIDVQAFSSFDRLEGVDAVFLDGAVQKAKTLTPKAPQFRLR